MIRGGPVESLPRALARRLVVLETLTGRQASLPSTEYEAGTPDAPEGFPNLLELFHEEMDEADGAWRSSNTGSHLVPLGRRGLAVSAACGALT